MLRNQTIPGFFIPRQNSFRFRPEKSEGTGNASQPDSQKELDLPAENAYNSNTVYMALRKRNR